jgi:hypothetical protein
MVSGALLLAGCASSPTDNTAAIDRACDVQDCFLERDVRDFEVIDQTTLIVYIGSQRCAFKVDLRGTLCDLTFAPEIYFRSPSDALTSGARPGDDLFGSNLEDRDVRVCSNDLQIDVDGGVFTESRPLGDQRSATSVDRFGRPRSQCQIAGVASLTDDQLVELYVARGMVAPPPPMGAGEIEVGEQEEGEDSAVTQPGQEGQAEPTLTQSNIAAASATTTADSR